MSYIFAPGDPVKKICGCINIIKCRERLLVRPRPNSVTLHDIVRKSRKKVNYFLL